MISNGGGFPQPILFALTEVITLTQGTGCPVGEDLEPRVDIPITDELEHVFSTISMASASKGLANQGPIKVHFFHPLFVAASEVIYHVDA